MKVLWVGDAVITSGFSNVTHNICDNLVNKCDLMVFGIGYDGKSINKYNYKIYPAKFRDDIYGFDYFSKVVKEEEPDIIVIFNDDDIVRRYLDIIKDVEYGKRVLLFPVNMLPISIDNMLSFSIHEFHVSHVLSYTEFSKTKILGVNPNLRVDSIYHGVCHDIFYPVENAKKELGLQDLFVVGNISTNTLRKRLDLFIKGFSVFAKDKDNVRCVIHTSSNNSTYNIKFLADYYGISNKLTLTNNNLSSDKLNLLYNILDVSVNTSLGEGFGLTLLESSACGIPILCPQQGNLNDIWGNAAHYIKLAKYRETVPNTTFEGEVIDLDDFVECLELFYNDKEYASAMGKAAFNRSKDEKFNWEVVSNKVYKVIEDSYQYKINILNV